VPGTGIVLMGVSALVAAVFAHTQTHETMLLVWACEAVLALAIGLVALLLETRRVGVVLAQGSARTFLLALVPSGICAAALSAALAVHGHTSLIPAVWLTGYGTGVIAAGAHSVPAVPVMGALFVVSGLIALVLPPEHHNALLAVAFGGIHVVVGIFIARHHGS